MNPLIEKYWQDELWLDFINKYELMVREKINIVLRNSARQRRNNKRFFLDLQILIREANFTDEKLMQKNGVKISPQNTTGLSLAIGMALEQMLGYLNTAFSLELARTEELVMHFM